MALRIPRLTRLHRHNETLPIDNWTEQRTQITCKQKSRQGRPFNDRTGCGTRDLGEQAPSICRRTLPPHYLMRRRAAALQLHTLSVSSVYNNSSYCLRHAWTADAWPKVGADGKDCLQLSSVCLLAD